MKQILIVSALASALLLPAGASLAADKGTPQEKAQAFNQQQIYGSQLMTRHERAAYRARMRAAKTAEERERIRREHHEQMKARAKARGIALPAEPPAIGAGMGPGGGNGY